MKVAPIDILLNKEAIPEKKFFLISGNEITLMEKIKSLIINKYKEKEAALVTKFDTLKGFVDEIGLFENKKIYLVNSCKSFDEKTFNNIRNTNNIFIFIQENSQSIKRVKNFFNKEKGCCLVDCYELEKDSRIKILNKFINDNKLVLSKDVYWLMVEKLESKYMFFETSLKKILGLGEKELNIDYIRKLITTNDTGKEKVFFNLLKNNKDIIRVYRSKIINDSDANDLYYQSKFFCQLIIEADNISEYQKKIPIYLFKEKNFLIELYKKYNSKKKKMLVRLLSSTERFLRKERSLSLVFCLRFLLSIKKITIS